MKRRLTTKDSDGDNDDESDSGIADDNIAETMIAMIVQVFFPFNFRDASSIFYRSHNCDGSFNMGLRARYRLVIRE